MTDPRELYGRWLLELWSGDLDVAEEIVADDFAGHWPDHEVRGRDALVATIRETHAMFESVGFALELDPLVDGDRLAARWRGRATLPDGEEMRFVGHDILRIEGGRFAEYWVATWTPS